MGERSRIAGFVRIIGYGGRIELRQQTFIALGCLIDISADFELGSRSQIGPRCILYSHGGTGLIYNMRYPHRIGKIKIGSDSWIGMNCVIHPGIAVGDRVIVLPGMVMRCNIPDDTAMISPADEHRFIPTTRLLIGVSDDVRLRKIESIFFNLAAVSRGSESDQSDSDIWHLHLAGRKTLHLLRTGSAQLDALQRTTMDHVVWTLFERGVVKGVPTFCFEKLTVYGPWTPFAERLAAFLLSEGGTHFVFENTASRHTPACKDNHETC
jgi:carbonic anhydrase/acetyltransferase-like protein (isoleucine patch superfamily)